MKKYWRYFVWALYVSVIGWFQFRHNLFHWVAGVGLSLVLFMFDRLLYVWWLKPYEQLSIQIQYWWKQKDFPAVWRLLRERGKEQTKLALHSVGFAVVWPLLAIYVMTSTGSVIAVGMVMGLGLGLGLALIQDWHYPQELTNWFCWQIKRPFSTREVRIVAGSYLFIWLLFSLMVAVR